MNSEQQSLDQAYREDLQRNPYNVKNWLYYLEFRKDARAEDRFLIYDEALSYLPRSFKLWKLYLHEYENAIGTQSVLSPIYQQLNNKYEQSLLYLETMPVLWYKYLTLLLRQPFLITKTRTTFNRALRALPITQHIKWVWPLYIQFAEQCQVPATSASIWKRFLTISVDNQYLEDYVQALVHGKQWDRAAMQYARLLDLPNFVSRHGKTRYETWTDFLQLIVHHSKDIVSVDCEQVIRGGLQRYPHECATLWCALSEMFIRQGHLEKARSSYLEAIDSVLTLRDFRIVSEAYTKFELALLESLQAALDDLYDQLDQLEEQGDTNTHASYEAREKIEYQIQLLTDESALYEHQLRSVVASRELCINNVLLRQQPHNVNEWLVRVKLYKTRYEKITSSKTEESTDSPTSPSPQQQEQALMAVLLTYHSALEIVDPSKAIGRYHDLWISLANFYLEHQQPDDARAVYERAITKPMQSIRALTYVLCSYVEMELVLGFPQRARSILEKVLLGGQHTNQLPSPSDTTSSSSSVSSSSTEIARQLSLWSLYADITESICSFEVTKQVYETVIQRRLHTPIFTLHYIHILFEHGLLDQAFQMYERSIHTFRYPQSAPLWLNYLHHFIQHYAYEKPLHVRDLFRDALKMAPVEYKKGYYLLYIKYEQNHGTPRQLLRVIHEACTNVQDKDEKYLFYRLYIRKMAENYGLDETRPIFAEALEVIDEAVLPELGIKFATLEIKLNQIDRARQIFTYVANSSDPNAQPQFWKAFEQFETTYGNINSFKDMRRLQRKVRLKYEESSLLRKALELQKEQEKASKEKTRLAILSQPDSL